MRPAGDEREVKSVGNGMTFRRNLDGEEDVRAGVLTLCDTVAARLRRYGLCCQTVQVQIKSPQFRVISRQRPLEHPTDLLAGAAPASMELVRQNWDLRAPIRMLTVTAAGLGGKDAGSSSPSLPTRRSWPSGRSSASWKRPWTGCAPNTGRGRSPLPPC